MDCEVMVINCRSFYIGFFIHYPPISLWQLIRCFFGYLIDQSEQSNSEAGALKVTGNRYLERHPMSMFKD